jgi:hypothetical protein
LFFAWALSVSQFTRSICGKPRSNGRGPRLRHLLGPSGLAHPRIQVNCDGLSPDNGAGGTSINTFFDCSNPDTNDPYGVDIQLDASQTAAGDGGKLILDGTAHGSQSTPILVDWHTGSISNNNAAWYKGDFILDNIKLYMTLTNSTKLGAHLWAGDYLSQTTGNITTDGTFQGTNILYSGITAGVTFWLGDGADVHLDDATWKVYQDNHAGNVADGRIETNTSGASGSLITIGGAGYSSKMYRTTTNGDTSIGAEIDCDIAIKSNGTLYISVGDLLHVRGQGEQNWSVKNVGGTLQLNGGGAELDAGVDAPGVTTMGYDQTSGSAVLSGGSFIDGLFKFEGGSISMDTALTSENSGEVTFSGTLKLLSGVTVNVEVSSSHNGWNDGFRDVLSTGSTLLVGDGTGLGPNFVITYDGANPPTSGWTYDLFDCNMGGTYTFNNWVLTSGYTLNGAGVGILKKN